MRVYPIASPASTVAMPQRDRMPPWRECEEQEGDEDGRFGLGAPACGGPRMYASRGSSNFSRHIGLGVERKFDWNFAPLALGPQAAARHLRWSNWEIGLAATRYPAISIVHPTIKTTRGRRGCVLAVWNRIFERRFKRYGGVHERRRHRRCR